MRVIVYGVFTPSFWRAQFHCLSYRSKLLLCLLAGISLTVITAGVILRQNRRRYRAKSVPGIGGALGRQSTFGRSRRQSRGHRRMSSFPMIYTTDDDTDLSTVYMDSTPGHSSVYMPSMDCDSLRMDSTEMFLSLSQNMSSGVLSAEEFYDISAEMDSLIPSYPSMMSPGGVDYLSDSDESFASASETLTYMNEKHKLYLSALMLADNGSISCRIMRTKELGCLNDRDFLAKVHCIRLALDHLLLSQENRMFAINAGKDLILSLLRVSNSDPESFITRYHDLLQYLQNASNLASSEQELKERGVACMNIYDVALDFMLLDAFDDLSSPPSALLSVIQNGWLSDRIKQSMLNTAVWSILKAKKSVLRNKFGFMSKFYLLSETMSPVFAWGFLGTDIELKRHCLRFKSNVMGLVRSMFSLEDVRYTSVESLGNDIMHLTRQTVHSLSTV